MRFVTIISSTCRSALFLAAFTGLATGCFQRVSAQIDSDANDRTIDYARDVAPIFQAHCYQCHGPTRQTSDLRLDLRMGILKGGGSGSIVQVGNSTASRLIEVVAGRDPDYAMPPEGDRLSEPEIAILRAWIDQGATGPEDSAELDRKLPWSFEPVVRPLMQLAQDALKSVELPKINGEVDYFLVKRLMQSGLGFSPHADRRVLIRRLYCVALGVPPSPADVELFVNDDRPNAFEQLVDRVLADDRYGERMARHWFDVVRFAESNGFETNRVRYNAWPYRDYVIQAFNSDTPYNQFVAEQIVGDKLGNDVATGYLVAGTYDLVKSPDINLTLMQRQDELADLINTTGTAFIGLTLGCARCHDHKFDPITQVDFYSLQAVLAGVNFGERPLPQQQDRQTADRVKQIELEISQQDKVIKQLLVSAAGIAQAAESPELLPEVNGKLNEEEFSPHLATAVRFKVLYSGDSQPCIDEWEVFNANGDNVALSSAGAKASASSVLPGYAIHQIEHLNDGKFGNDFSWISNEVNAGMARIDFLQPELISRMKWGRDRSQRFRDRLIRHYQIEALCEGEWREIASSKLRKPSTADAKYLIARLPEKDQTAYRSATQVRERLQEELKLLTGGQTAWLGNFSQPDSVHRLYRGDPLMRREPVAPAMVAALGGQRLPDDLPEQDRRQALADWLTDTRNPLTARVMVNRLWQYTFGAGIVDTPSDFGRNGTIPSHPELLDWLADEFVSSGWSIKHVHRLLLTSYAFQQSSQPSRDGLSVDSDTRLLWRFPPRRLEAEAIRDSMLVCSGDINWQKGGPGFFLQRVEQDNVYRYFPKEEYGREESRRMVYLTRIRGEQDPVFGSFDCPNGNQVIPKRSRSNTPLQALNLFNSRFVEQQAEVLAARLERETALGSSRPETTSGGAAAIERQIVMAFELLVSRRPDRYEEQASRDLIGSQGLVAFCRAMLNTTEFLFIF